MRESPARFIPPLVTRVTAAYGIYCTNAGDGYHARVHVLNGDR